MDIRLQHHLAQEFYRQQMLQRIPDPYSSIFPTRQLPPVPPRFSLPSVDVKLQNEDLWSEFHKIGTEMIITKCGRRMFPSMRISMSGLEADQSYCVLLEMVPTADCRFKFSGSNWIPAGGAEPQSLQNIYIHPDSPALGSHWQAQPINFNKTKLTNNTLDSNGHVVLTSMHKYQPRVHIVRTSDPSQIPWSPQKSFVFNETEFVAVTAYQNDRITKLKIDNNPFAKGFRETGQSRCKRKMASPSSSIQESSKQDEYSDSTFESDNKRLRVLTPSEFSTGSTEDCEFSTYESSSNGSRSPATVVHEHQILLSTSPTNLERIHYPYALQQFHQILGLKRHWMSHLAMPFSSPEKQLMSSSKENVEIGPAFPQENNISISFVHQSMSDGTKETTRGVPKVSNFSIAAILGL